jgi:peptide-methionine (R)-S-oxide reductase
MITRRNLMLTGTGAVAVAAAGFGYIRFQSNAVAQSFEITMTDAAWKAKLDKGQYLVLRHEETERPFTNPLLHEKRAGLYHCAGCDLAVYSSDAKYDSGTGWPSFTASLPDAIGTKTDYALIVPRTEVHCRRCGGHFGHIFDDGPPPSGKRHCLNGLALTFVPA